MGTHTGTDRKTAGKALRERCPRNTHGNWKAPRNRRDPIELLIASSIGRRSSSRSGMVG
jgi:hypothetical protein